MNSFQVGFSRRKITPLVGTRLFGYPGARPSQSLHDDLFTSALAFSSDSKKALLLSLDLAVIDPELSDTMREKIAAETAISADRIIVALIHTHSGPLTDSQNGWGDADTDFIDNVIIPQTILSAIEALAALQPAEMGIGETLSEVGINRRELTENGEVILGQNPDGPYDPKMRVLSFRTPEGQPIVSLIHYGAHPTSAGANPEITRDWPGFMIDRLEKLTGAPAVFVNGAEGDVGPRLSNGKTTGDLEQTKEIGLMAGDDAVRAYRSIRSYAVPKLSVKVGELTLPYRPLPTLDETKAALDKLGDPDKLIEVDLLFYARYKKILAHYEQNEPIETEWHFKQTYIALDSVVFVPYPFEMFCEITLNQQKYSPFPHTLCLSNTNGTICYLPTEDQLPYGGYEVDSFYARRLFVFEDQADRQIVEENQKLLRALFE